MSGLSTIYSLTLNLPDCNPELVPVPHGHPRPPAGPRPRRGAAASQIRPQSTDRDAVGRSEAQVGECIAHPGLSPGPINTQQAPAAPCSGVGFHSLEMCTTRACLSRECEWRAFVLRENDSFIFLDYKTQTTALIRLERSLPEWSNTATTKHMHMSQHGGGHLLGPGTSDKAENRL